MEIGRDVKRPGWGFKYEDNAKGEMKRSIFLQIGTEEVLDFETLLSEVRLAEELGIDGVWCFPSAGADGKWSESAAPIWLSALANQTQRIRLGWGVPGIFSPTLPPIRVAEQAAAIDLASRGRLDLAFVPDDDIKDVEIGPWDEGIRMLVEMWAQPAFSWTSERFTVRPVDVVPKPVQHPHPPLWLAGWSTEQAKRAGQGGMAFLDISGGTEETLLSNQEIYRKARADVDPKDLVSMGLVGIAIEADLTGDARTHFDRWESLGFDEVILRTRPIEGRHEAAEKRIRFLAK
jgi:alkanesulfonate monooxygenase SsuD/methylene tetrahydromethanopterin reductase-like flavin-dependent oxidoreductase (luciferase family)